MYKVSAIRNLNIWEQRQVLRLEGAVSEEKTLKKRKELSRVELMEKGNTESSDLYSQIA